MERVAIIKSLMNKRSRDGRGRCKVYDVTNTAEITNVVVTGKQRVGLIILNVC